MASKARFLDNVGVSAFGTNSGGDSSVSSSYALSASYADSATSASYAISASYEITKEVSSSYADTASFAQSGDGIFSGSFSGSFQGDGSNLTGVGAFPFSGSAVITGSLTITGSQTLNTQAVEKVDLGRYYIKTLNSYDTGFFGTLGGQLIISSSDFTYKSPFLVLDRGAGGPSGATDGLNLWVKKDLYVGGSSQLGDNIMTIFKVSGSATTGNGGQIDLGSPGLTTDINLNGHLTASAGVNISASATSTASFGTYLGDGSQLTGISTTPFPFSGSAVITGSLEISGSSDVTLDVKGDLNVSTNITASNNISSSNNIFSKQHYVEGKLALDYNNGIAIGNLSDSLNLLGTSITASSNLSSSAASTASFGTYLGDGSQLTGISTTPFPFSGSAVITGSLVISGSNTTTGIPPFEILNYADRITIGGNGRAFHIQHVGEAIPPIGDPIPPILTISGSGTTTGGNPSINIGSRSFTDATIGDETIVRFNFFTGGRLTNLADGTPGGNAFVFSVSGSATNGNGGIIGLGRGGTTPSNSAKIHLNGHLTASAGVNISASATSTASFGTYLGDGSQLTGIETDPFPFSGSAVITGSLVVSGSFNAFTLDADNVVLGSGSGLVMQAGADSNVLIGTAVGTSLTTGDYNILIGSDVGGTLDTEANNIMIGKSTGRNSDGGDQNVYIGSEAGRYGSNAEYNVAIGYHTLRGGSGNTGDYNTALGYYAGRAIDNGAYNTFIGYFAGNDVTTGDNNILIGNNAGAIITTGEKNIFIGSGSLGETGTTNQLKIGHAGLITISASLATGDILLQGDVSSSATSTASFGTYLGDGSQLSGISSTPFPFTGDAQITGSLEISGSGNITSSGYMLITSSNTGGGNNSLMTPGLVINQVGSSQNHSGPAIRLVNSTNGEETNIYHQPGGSGASHGNALNILTDGGINIEAGDDIGSGGAFFRLAKGQALFTIDDDSSAPRTDVKIHNGNGGTAYSRLSLGAQNEYWYIEADDNNTPFNIGFDNGSTDTDVITFTKHDGSLTGSLEIVGGPLKVTGSLISSGSVVNFTGATAISGSTFSGSFVGNGSGLTNLPASDPFPFSGSAVITGSLIVSSSTSESLSVQGSGSTIFDVIGSQGTIFSVDDDLSGTIFTANDISGLPILEVSASGDVYIGKSPQSLYTTAVISSTTAAVTQSIFGLSTSSYDGAFFDYTVQSGSNARAGSIMSVWNGSTINFTETTTTDIGDTTDFNLIVHISQSQAQIASHATRAGYNIKTIIRSI